MFKDKFVFSFLVGTAIASSLIQSPAYSMDEENPPRGTTIPAHQASEQEREEFQGRFLELQTQIRQAEEEYAEEVSLFERATTREPCSLLCNFNGHEFCQQRPATPDEIKMLRARRDAAEEKMRSLIPPIEIGPAREHS